MSEAPASAQRVKAQRFREGVTINRAVLEATLNTLSEPLLVIGSDRRVTFVNAAWRRLREQLGEPDGDKAWLEPVYGTAYQAGCGNLLSNEAARGVEAVLGGTLPRYETVFKCAAGYESRTLKLEVLPLALGCPGALLSYHDLTEQTRRETEIYNLANLDPLTGLFNRRLFFAEAERVLALAERHGHPFTLLYLDLDGFKAVNDSSGHEVGDEVLCRVAARLGGCLRKSDLLARLGGDEFLLLLPETDERESLVTVKRCLESLTRPFTVDGHTITLTGSFGVAHYPTHARTIDELVRLADKAMYQAKANGGGVRVVPRATVHRSAYH